MLINNLKSFYFCLQTEEIRGIFILLVNLLKKKKNVIYDFVVGLCGGELELNNWPNTNR